MKYEDIQSKLLTQFSVGSLTSEGVRYLKLRTLIDVSPLKQSNILKNFFLERKFNINAKREEINSIRKRLFESEIDDLEIDSLIRSIFKEISEKVNYENLMKELIKVTLTSDFIQGWNGVFRDNIRDHIQHRYVREISIQKLDDLIHKVTHELPLIIKGYTVMSWYNQWTSKIIENFFMTHPNVVPTIRPIKYVDFFLSNVPVDLKVTFLPACYLKKKKKELQTKQDSDVIDYFKINPLDVCRWLYENQGIARFDDSNRLFIVMVDESDLTQSWKLKSDFSLLKSKILTYLSQKRKLNGLDWIFSNKGKFHTMTDVISITKNNIK